MSCRRKRCQRIHPVVLAEQLPSQAPLPFALPCNFEASILGCGAGGPSFGHAESLNRRPSSFCKYSLQGCVLPIHHQKTRFRHDPYEVSKLAFNRSEIVEDVGMVELEIIQNRGLRTVMHELGALIEERGVVFIGL